MNPKVSVVIPTYNSAQFIVETLESVFAQTYRDYEIVIVDDGSMDNTKQVLQPYMSRIRYIYKANGGPASARNVGIKNAKGEYIAFLDSDDLWLPEKLEKQMEYFQVNPDVGLVYSDCTRFTEDGICQQRSLASDPAEGYVFFRLLEGVVFPTSTVIAKKECFGKEGYFDDELNGSEDYDMWLRISRSFKVGYVQGPLVKHRIREEGHNRSNIDRAHKAAFAVIEKALENIESEFFDKDAFLRDRLFGLHHYHGLRLFSGDDLRRARGEFAAAMKYRPVDFKTVIYYAATFLTRPQIRTLRKIKRRLLR